MDGAVRRLSGQAKSAFLDAAEASWPSGMAKPKPAPEYLSALETVMKHETDPHLRRAARDRTSPSRKEHRHD